MPEASRQLVAQINLSALRQNLKRVRDYVSAAQIFAVVKADAYGHGLKRILPALDEVDGLALMELPAAIELREANYTRRILLLEGFFRVGELKEFSQYRIATVVHNHEQLQMLEKTKLEKPLEVFLSVNTGMNRLGIKPHETKAFCERLSALPAVAALRLMTHLARAETKEGSAEALARFESACAGLSYPRSIANSAGVLRFRTVGGDIVRPGLMIYGASPIIDRPARLFGLQPVMSLRSELIAVQDVPEGEYVGYGEVYRTTRPTRIGVVACGYADGYPITARPGTPVQVAGKRATIAGRVSMDMLTVDITDIPEAHPGSPVLLWGDGLPVDDVARWSGLIPYQLLCAIAPRVKFVTTEIGRVHFDL